MKFLAKEIAKQNNDTVALAIIENSEFEIREETKNLLRGHYYLTLNTLPSIYAKYFSQIERIHEVVHEYVNTHSDYIITTLVIKVDYSKISILNSEISIIDTPWNEINSLQKKLVEDAQISSSSIDFQNIGNTSRTIMDKLARIIFNPSNHVAPSGIDVRNGKYKNQFHAYISTILTGSENKELRQFSTSAIDFTENAIDLMNQTTHKLDVKRHFAEVCVISTISVISLIKAIYEIEQRLTLA